MAATLSTQPALRDEVVSFGEEESLAGILSRPAAPVATLPALVCLDAVLEERYNHPDQLFEIFPRLLGRAKRRLFREANHRFTELATQAQLLGTICESLERWYR